MGAEESDPSKARKWYLKMLDLKRELAKDTEDRLAQLELGITYSHFASLELRQRNFDAAIDWVAKQIAILKELVNRSPTDPDVRKLLAFLYLDLADIHVQRSYNQLALVALRNARTNWLEVDLGPTRIPYTARILKSIDERIEERESIEYSSGSLESIANMMPKSRRLALFERLQLMLNEGALDGVISTVRMIEKLEDKTPRTGDGSHRATLELHNWPGSLLNKSSDLLHKSEMKSGGFDSLNLNRLKKRLSWLMIVSIKVI